jgi:hypothetical protein
LIIFIFSFFNSNIYAKHCGAHLLKAHRELVRAGNDIPKRQLQEAVHSPLRIHLDYSFIDSKIEKYKKQDVIDLKEKIMPKAAEIFQRLLKVKRISGLLKLNSTRCDAYHIPEKYSFDGEGVPADVVIFVMIDDTGFFIENHVEAAAVHCLQHFRTKRPVAGYIQFKPELQVSNSTALDYMVWLAVHEMTHILGFNDGLYEDWVDENFNQIGIFNVIGKGRLKSGKPYSFIKSPRVLAKAREHFNCTSLEGVPLEYNGGAGTAGAHWSKKYMNTDYMIGDSYGENLISDITLAMFEDSGWYQVDYSNSNYFYWGKMKGCDFFNANCIDNMNNNNFETKFKNEFCVDFNQQICSTSHIFRANCTTIHHQRELPLYNRYFDNSKYGGIDPLTDYCPIAIENKNNEVYYGGSCRVGSVRNLDKIEKVCPECACFMSNLKENATNATNFRFLEKNLIKQNTVIHLKASCYEFKCEGANLFVVIGGKSVACNANGDTIVPGYSGTIKCPNAELLCHQKFQCKYGCTEKYENAKHFFNYSFKK